jgi:threonine aldolase
MFKGIDLFSDTITQPSRAMKEAMMNAELGDEQKGEDPTTRELEEMAADILGQKAAMFFPSATMANEVAIRLLTNPGDELIAADNCHLFFAEAGGPAIHAGVMARPIRTQTGLFTGQDVRNIYRWSKGPHYPISKLLSIENTTNAGGGHAWNPDDIAAVLTVAKELNLKTHLDGSRLFNAVVRTKTTAKIIAENFDTVTICLSKGLGCPIGAILAYPANDFAKVRRLKQLFGGAMRQSGIIAAAGIYALKNNISRLAEDHANAELLAEKMHAEVDEIHVENVKPSTNMVFFEWTGTHMTADEFLERCIAEGIRFSHFGERRFRAVTHMHITEDDVNKVIAALKKVCLSKKILS